MNKIPPASWNPDHRWADKFIATLVLLILVLLGGQARVRRLRVHGPETEVTLEGRLEDIALAGPGQLQARGRSPLALKALAATAAQTRPGWDQAILAVHAGENDEKELGLALAQTAPSETGDHFRQLWRHCYLGEPAHLSAEERQGVRKALGDGYAARILEARLQAQTGGDAQGLEDAARLWARPRLLLMGAAFAGALLLGLSGLGFALYLATQPGHPRPLPTYGLSGRAVLIVLLGWFLTLLAAGPAVGFVLALFPFLRPISLPLVYAFHALAGTAYLCAAEGVDIGTLWRRLCPGHGGRAAASGLGFFALAFAAVMAVTMGLSPLLRHAEPPQKELLELMAHLQGPVAVILVFLTVAVLAPVFEELMFRGFLLPWLGERLGRRLGKGRGTLLALVITAVTFGAMHMQPWGLPTLSTLGFVLGLAYVRSGNLGTAILVHGLWNGGVFIAMRLLSGL
jgi:membrane protease YdiL (CAAX protease family)